MCAAVVTMRLVFPGAAALGRAWLILGLPRSSHETLSAFGAVRLRRRAPSHFQSLYEVWHGVGCQIRRQAGHGAANSRHIYREGSS